MRTVLTIDTATDSAGTTQIVDWGMADFAKPTHDKQSILKQQCRLLHNHNKLLSDADYTFLIVWHIHLE